MKATENNGYHRSALHSQNASGKHDAFTSQIAPLSMTEGCRVGLLLKS